MNDILKEAKRLGIKFEEEIEEDLERLSELQELLRQAERQSVYLEEEGEVTTLHDEVIAKVCEEIPVEENQTPRYSAPKNIATFNSYAEALEPMAGALWTSYHASFPARWVEAMKKPSRAGGKPAKARSRRRSSLKRNIEPKAFAHRNAVTEQPADWLEKLGMSEYAQRFAENRIDLSVLPELTDQHLKDLGIALGDRLKMLRAIRELADGIPASRQSGLHPVPQTPS